jgi:hypothetical protein
MVTAAVKRLGATLLALGASLGCSDILDIPSTDTLELAPSGPFRCVNAGGEPVAPSAATATVRFRACDFISNCTIPVTGLRARVCDKLDVGCLNPRATGIQDDSGLLEVEVPLGPRGFDGYVQVSTTLAPCFDTRVFGDAAGSFLCQLAPTCDMAAPTAACDVPVYSPVLWFFNPPVVADVEEPIPLELYPFAALPLVLDAAGGELVPGTGSVFMSVVDCDGKPAPGVTLQISEYEDVASPLYFDSGVLSNSATTTDASGIGGFILIPPGFVNFTAMNGDGETLGKVGVQADPAFVTLTVLAPSPVL